MAVAGAMASEVAIMLKTRNISVVPVVDDHRTRRFLGHAQRPRPRHPLPGRGQAPLAHAGGLADAHQLAGGAARTRSSTGYKVRMDLDPNESHLRPTITVVDGDGLVIGFISHPEQIPGVEIVWG